VTASPAAPGYGPTYLWRPPPASRNAVRVESPWAGRVAGTGAGSGEEFRCGMVRAFIATR